MFWSRGVERFVFCNYAHKPGMARSINEWLIQTATELGGFGLPLATVHPGDVDYVEYYREALQNGCVGIKSTKMFSSCRLTIHNSLPFTD